MPRRFSKTRFSRVVRAALLGVFLGIVWPQSANAQGNVRAWGINVYGQLGNGTTADSNTPVAVSNLAGVVAIASGGDHSLALKSDGIVWAWGNNSYGQLGNGTNTVSFTPVQVSNLASVVAIAAGGAHSLALKSDGTVWAWGYNGSGQLGNGTNTSSNMPVPVSNLVGVTAIAAGRSPFVFSTLEAHSLALKSDGTVWTWGSNVSGQLGNGTNTSSNTPVAVSNLAGVVAIASGGDHSLALKSNGTVWTWGSNVSGQLGNGTNTSSNTPVPVSNLVGVTAIAGGQFHSLALNSDGTVRAWGENVLFQLGNGTSAYSNTPVPVSNLAGVSAIASGGFHSLALKSDGTVQAWGYNQYGQLGSGNNGFLTNSNTPVPVSNLAGVSAIAGGSRQSLALIGSGCSFPNSSAGASFVVSGGSGSVAVSSPSNCSWIATSNASWITVTSGATGSGNGTVAYAVAANPALTARTGTIIIASQTFTVTQGGTGNSAPIALAVSPPSGSGYTQNFNFVFSDLDGFADLVTTEVIFNSMLDASFACAIAFDRAANSASLVNDTAASRTSLTFGTPGSAANGQCAIDVSQASFSASGTTLTVANVAITFTQLFAGSKNIYGYAQDAGGLSSGLSVLGIWTVPAFTDSAPSAVSVNPASGMGGIQTFAFTFSDANGYADLASPEVIINSTMSASNGCAVVYNRRANTISLLNNSGFGSTAVALGTVDTAQNSQCVIYGSGSSAVGAGPTLALNLAFGFKSAFAGAKNIYMLTTDAAGLSSGIQLRGTWTVPSSHPQAPSAGSITPASGSGHGAIFTYTFTDPNGLADLIYPEIIFNLHRDARNACTILYDRFSNRFFLVNDSSTGSTSVTAGTPEFTENGQCLLSGTGSSATGTGNTLSITINVTFKQPFAGVRNVFLFAQSVEGLNTGLPMVGSWTVPSYANQPPVNVSVTPASGSGSGQLFQLRFRDPNGFGDLVSPEFILNGVLDARNSCTVILDKLNGAALLLNDTATAATSVLLNSAQTAQNSQCILFGQGSLVIAAGTDLVLQLNLQFKPAFSGAKTVYMYTSDQAGANSGLEAKGTFTVQ